MLDNPRILISQYAHFKPIKYKEYNESISLANYVHHLINRAIHYRLSCAIVDADFPYQGLRSTSALCLEEAIKILTHNSPQLPNKHNEVSTVCKHNFLHIFIIFIGSKCHQ